MNKRFSIQDKIKVSAANLKKIRKNLKLSQAELAIKSGISLRTYQYIETGKQINRVTLPETCSRCDMNNEDECTEGYYGVRLYEDANGTHKVGVCIQRMDLTVDMDTFIASPIADEIVDFRKAEYERLTQKYGSFIQE